MSNTIDAGDPAAFQSRVSPWMMACFGPEVSRDAVERNHRFLEESLELVQACGCTQSEAHQLVDYVFGRPVGDPKQEAGGVMVTLAALCLAQGLDMHEAGEIELARIWTKVDQIRAKQAAKPKHSPLPATPPPPAAQVVEALTCPYCADPQGAGATYYTQTCPGCVARMGGSVVGLGQGNGVVSADIDQRIPVAATGAQEETAAIVDLGRDGSEHDLKAAGSALPHGEPPDASADRNAAARMGALRLTKAEIRVLDFCTTQMTDLSPREWINHGFRKATFDSLTDKLLGLK